ncbi:hypothetical protein BWI75_19315 [Gloeocapsopsis sp. AAB1 = 1H9]|uniref:Uncharacterized protein n=1 Tax=Gloeocapsopsis dulcis AAB1 = 1H9 TaxID=1433147 RepID=A0A6N8FZX9_9CHRO|nr:hypothetical protein [Gloeocapsopsis dulcis AAB1 = 1H9]
MFAQELLNYARRLDRGENTNSTSSIDNVHNQKALDMLKETLNYPTNSFCKGKAIIKEVISIMENVQNQ